MKKILIFSLIVLQFMNPFAYREAHSASLYADIKYNDIDNHWAKEAILDVTGTNYMVGKSATKFAPKDNITNVETLTLILRILDYEKRAQQTDIKNWTKGVYQVSQSLGLIDKPEDKEVLLPNPKANTTREEFFGMLGKAIYGNPPLGDQIVETRNFNDFSSIKEEHIPYIEALLKEGYFEGDKNGNFNPKRPISRGEVAQVISNKMEDLAMYRNIATGRGMVTDVKPNEILIFSQDGTSVSLEKSKFPVQKNGIMYDSSGIATNDRLIYFKDANFKPMYVKVIKEDKSELIGTLEEIDLVNRRLVLYDFNEKRHSLDVPKSIDMTKLYFDQEVHIELRNGKIEDISRITNLDPEQHGYIIPGTRFKVGKVLFVSKDQLEIQTDSGREKYKIEPFFTEIYKKSQQVELFQVKEGDRVLLTFDDIYSSDISQIKVEDEEKHITGVLRSKIGLVDDRNKEVLLKDNYIYENGKWNKLNGDIKVNQGTGSIYNGSKKIKLTDLKKNLGKTAYVAYEEPYGKKSIGKLLVLAGSPMEYENKVQDIDYGSGSMTVATTLMDFHEGSIVVKDNRLVDPLNLGKGQSVYLGTDYAMGKRGLGFASIEGTSPIDDRVDGTNIVLYKGKIEDILDYKLVLGNNNYRDKMEIDHSGFKTNRDSEEFIFTEDTLILDQELKEYIPVKAFKDSRYIDLIDIRDREIRRRLEKNYYKNSSAYVIAKTSDQGKILLGVSLVPHEARGYSTRVDKDFATTGLISSIEIESGNLGLKDVKNYNTLTGTWDRAAKQNINGKNAIIILNDQPIKANELNKARENARVYVLRQKDKSTSTDYIIVIED